MYLTLSASRTAPVQKPTEPQADKTDTLKAKPEVSAAVKKSDENEKVTNGTATTPAELKEDEQPGALVPIASVPKFISREEHISLTSTTPASWTDIPPVLHFNEEGVKIEFDPAYRNQTEMKGDIWVTEG
jgi:hypothetical protein